MWVTEEKSKPTSNRLFCLVSQRMLLGKRALALVLECIMAIILCIYPKGALGQGFSQLEIQIAGGPADHTPVLRLGIQSSMTRDNMSKRWSEESGSQCCSLKPCSFWAENRHALVCKASQMNCNFVHQFIGRGNPFFFCFCFHPPTCSSSSLEVFMHTVSQASNDFNVWLRSERAQTCDVMKHIGWGIHDCHHLFSLWLNCRLFQQDELLSIHSNF